VFSSQAKNALERAREITRESVIFLQTLLKHKYTDNVTDFLTVFFIVCKIYFRVGFIESRESCNLICLFVRSF